MTQRDCFDSLTRNRSAITSNSVGGATSRTPATWNITRQAAASVMARWAGRKTTK